MTLREKGIVMTLSPLNLKDESLEIVSAFLSLPPLPPEFSDRLTFGPFCPHITFNKIKRTRIRIRKKEKGYKL